MRIKPVKKYLSYDEFAIASDVWDELPKDVQKILRDRGNHPCAVIKCTFDDTNDENDLSR